MRVTQCEEPAASCNSVKVDFATVFMHYFG
ncbi:hypothetical protein LEWO105114_07725 [Legionella worsleiensis]|nr:Uncharacterised protein [Legionella worsleiensis]